VQAQDCSATEPVLWGSLTQRMSVTPAGPRIDSMQKESNKFFSLRLLFSLLAVRHTFAPTSFNDTILKWRTPGILRYCREPKVSFTVKGTMSGWGQSGNEEQFQN
jgi:hypothetical protein